MTLPLTTPAVLRSASDRRTRVGVAAQILVVLAAVPWSPRCPFVVVRDTLSQRRGAMLSPSNDCFRGTFPTEISGCLTHLVSNYALSLYHASWDMGRSFVPPGGAQT